MGVGGVGVQLALLAATVLGLWIGARTLVDAVVNIARSVGISELAIGLTVVAIGTSTPELVVTTDAAMADLGELAVANVIGSNSYNLAFILGAVSLLRFIPVERSLVHRDGIALMLATIGGAVVLLDQSVTTIEGVGLMLLFVLYTAFLIHAERSDASIATGYVPSPAATVIDRAASFRGRDVFLAIAGLVLVLVSGHFLVEIATDIAQNAGISDWVIGGTIVAAGTSTPEFAVSIVAMRQGYVGMSVGNIVGSNIFNLLGVLGFAAAIQPLVVSTTAIESLLWLVAITGIMVAALWSGRKLSRLEGGMFVLSEIARWILGLFRIFG